MLSNVEHHFVVNYFCIHRCMYVPLFLLTILVNYNSLRKRAQLITAYYRRIRIVPIMQTDWFTVTPSAIRHVSSGFFFQSEGGGVNEILTSQKKTQTKAPQSGASFREMKYFGWKCII